MKMVDKKRVLQMVIEGLEEDGGHHKQYFLEKILKELVGQEEFNMAKNDLEWESGIAP